MTAARLSAPAMRTAIHLAALAANAIAAWPAAAQPELPDAFRRWFTTDPAVVCVDADGRDRRCSISAAEHIGVHRDPADARALVFVTYLPDPSAIGDATRIAAAAFRRDPAGWRLVRMLPGVRAELAGKVVFDRGGVTYPVAVPKPGDARCSRPAGGLTAPRSREAKGKRRSGEVAVPLAGTARRSRCYLMLPMPLGPETTPMRPIRMFAAAAVSLAIPPAVAGDAAPRGGAWEGIVGVYRAVDAAPAESGVRPSESVMEVVPVGRNEVYVRTRTTWANYHKCDLQAVFHVEPNALTYRGRTAAGVACGFDIERRPDRFVFRDPTGACLGECGARGQFDGDDRFRTGRRRPIRYLARILASPEYAAAIAARDGRIPRPETYLLDRVQVRGPLR